MEAVVVTETLDWKLHGFDLLTEHSIPVRHSDQVAGSYAAVQLRAARHGVARTRILQHTQIHILWSIDCSVHTGAMQVLCITSRAFRHTGNTHQCTKHLGNKLDNKAT